MKHPLLALGATALLAGAAQAQGPATSDPAAVDTGAYTVEASHTQVVFALSHLGFSTYAGFFSQASGTLTLDADPARDKVAITIPVASVMTTSSKLDHELAGADWFDAATYSTAGFVSRRVTQTGHAMARIEGTLTLHGISRPVTLYAHLVGSGTNPLSHRKTVGFDATANIQRSAFGVSKYVPLVGDAVSLHLSVAFEKD